MGCNIFRRQSRLCRGHGKGCCWDQARLRFVGLISPKTIHDGPIDVLNAYDAKDPTSVSSSSRQLAAAQADQAWPASNLASLRIGIPQEYFPTELSDEVLSPMRTVIEDLKSRGATIVPVSLPSTPYALSAYYVISSAEASSNMSRYDGVQYGIDYPQPPPSLTQSKHRTACASTPWNRPHQHGRDLCSHSFCRLRARSPKAYTPRHLRPHRRVSNPFLHPASLSNISAPSTTTFCKRNEYDS